MVRENGYVKLIDMGTAKFLNKLKTSTIIGTPHYMAPEMIEGRGYGFSADLWSLGVFVYELVTANVPYGLVFDQVHYLGSV